MSTVARAAINWRTTLLGAAAAGLNLYAQGVGIKQVGFAAAIALLGALAGDAKVEQADNK